MSRRNWFGSLSARPHRSAPCDRQTRLIFEPLGLLALNLKEEKMQIKLMAFLTFAMGAPTLESRSTSTSAVASGPCAAAGKRRWGLPPTAPWAGWTPSISASSTSPATPPSS